MNQLNRLQPPSTIPDPSSVGAASLAKSRECTDLQLLRLLLSTSIFSCFPCATCSYCGSIFNWPVRSCSGFTRCPQVQMRISPDRRFEKNHMQGTEKTAFQEIPILTIASNNPHHHNFTCTRALWFNNKLFYGTPFKTHHWAQRTFIP